MNSVIMSRDDVIIHNGKYLLAQCGPSVGHGDRLITLIAYCLIAGVKKKARIIGMVPRIDAFGHRQVAKVLDIYTGADPNRHRWMIDEHGDYRLLAL